MGKKKLVKVAYIQPEVVCDICNIEKNITYLCCSRSINIIACLNCISKTTTDEGIPLDAFKWEAIDDDE